MFTILFAKVNLLEYKSIFVRLIKVLKKNSKSQYVIGNIMIGSLVLVYVRRIFNINAKFVM
jgi:hypothetical protein